MKVEYWAVLTVVMRVDQRAYLLVDWMVDLTVGRLVDKRVRKLAAMSVEQTVDH